MIQLESMSEADFKAYIEVIIPDCAQENVKGGYWTAEEALAGELMRFKITFKNMPNYPLYWK